MSRRVLHSCGLTVVAAPADTDCTIWLETWEPGWRSVGCAAARNSSFVAGSMAALRAVAAAISVLVSKTVGGAAASDTPACATAKP